MNTRVCFGSHGLDAALDILRWVLSLREFENCSLEKMLSAEPRMFSAVMPEEWEQIILELRAGDLACVQASSIQDKRTFIALYSPRFGGGVRNLWMCMLDCDSPLGCQVYRRCRASSGVSFSAISVDDFPDFECADVTAENFPWSCFLLQVGAVRRQDGTWDERVGPLGNTALLAMLRRGEGCA